MPLPLNFRDLVMETLKNRGTMPQCEICGQNNWSVVEQAISAPISDLSTSISFPQPNIPCAGIICNNCGNLRLFALGALGINING